MIADALVENLTLQRLTLSNNTITEVSIQSKMKGLKELSLLDNVFHPEGGSDIGGCHKHQL